MELVLHNEVVFETLGRLTVLKLNFVLTVKMKFEPVFVTVAVAEVDDPLRDFTNNVHINALKKNTRRKEDILAKMTI